MKITLVILILIHGLIHFMGCAKAFHFGDMSQFTKEISKFTGVLWLMSGLLFIAAAILNLMKNETWTVLAIIVVILSQILIFTVWKDAKFGTIANVIILLAAIIDYGTQNFENSYKKDVVSAMEKMVRKDEIVTEKDLAHLPLVVQNYLQYVGVVGKPKVKNVKIVFDGEMREKGKEYFKFTSEQYNFFEEPTRLFFMKAKVKGLPTHGYHAYKAEKASMIVKLLSLFPVIQIDKPELYSTETVTFFNDLCLFAPSALIDDRITWEIIDDHSIKATFMNMGKRISSILYFNETGQLTNFVSNDRIAIDEMKAYPFSTPAKNYKNINGYNLPTYGEAVWYYPDGEFVYGRFNVKSIEYNVSKYK